MKIYELARIIEELAPIALQETYDNAGLIIGSPDWQISGALITLDVTEAVIEEAVKTKSNLIIAHHPLIFKGLKKLTGKNPVERMVANCIKNDIAIYAAHTNLDNISTGVNSMICEKIGLINRQILAAKSSMLKKIVTFCPVHLAGKVRNAMFDAGAGHIGQYDSCSFNLSGQGTFRALEGADPFVGEIDKLHVENETRIEIIYPLYKESQIISAMLDAHPYEEVAYDIYPLSNEIKSIGAGMTGELEIPENAIDFLKRIKNIFGAGCVKHTAIVSEKVQKIAVCGGSGSFLINDAIRAGADVFITGDIKYHEFFDADQKMIIADIGHYESEQFTRELLMSIIKKKNPTFAVRISGINTNPIQYI